MARCVHRSLEGDCLYKPYPKCRYAQFYSWKQLPDCVRPNTLPGELQKKLPDHCTHPDKVVVQKEKS